MGVTVIASVVALFLMALGIIFFVLHPMMRKEPAYCMSSFLIGATIGATLTYIIPGMYPVILENTVACPILGALQHLFEKSLDLTISVVAIYTVYCIRAAVIHKRREDNSRPYHTALRWLGPPLGVLACIVFLLYINGVYGRSSSTAWCYIPEETFIWGIILGPCTVIASILITIVCGVMSYKLLANRTFDSSLTVIIEAKKAVWKSALWISIVQVVYIIPYCLYRGGEFLGWEPVQPWIKLYSIWALTEGPFASSALLLRPAVVRSFLQGRREARKKRKTNRLVKTELGRTRL
eukprot:gnl/Dysnectes_brevis/12719_a28720_143.p1 GENE.gnl/Dysnectes_brevis/12719_a28720_143~~gnl/Dysnectes_brevis/12719_a28720_143.p1  ORF type:complete len:309 (+),score=93.79 gnl/Dysnectes_brevis/12719_a28720_143:48-929(+)